MNALEKNNFEQIIVHQSVPILLLKGGIAWFLLVFADYLYDQLPALSVFTSETSISSVVLSSQAIFHIITNILFGWLILFIVLHWFYEYYIIQPDAIIVRSGIIFSKQDVFQMEDVKSIDVAQGFWGKIFNTGTVKFYAFRMHKEIYLNNVPNPYEIAAQIHMLHPTPIGLNWPKQNSRKNQRPNIKRVDTEDLVED